MNGRCPACSGVTDADGVLHHYEGCEASFLVGNDEPCVFCGQTPRSGAWGSPCPDSPRKLHDTLQQLLKGHEEERASLGRYLSRAAYELDRLAAVVERLPDRRQRKLPVDLDPALIRNEAERARDGLHVHRLLDV